MKPRSKYSPCALALLLAIGAAVPSCTIVGEDYQEPDTNEITPDD